MGYHSTKGRSARQQRLGTVEIVCILLVLVAIAALVTFIVTNSGGGVLMT